jgi:hypothetical protein
MTACLFLGPASVQANPLDIPSAAPPQFRALLREKLHSNRGSFGTESRIDLGSKHGSRLFVVGEGNVVAFVVMRDRNIRGAAARKARSRSRLVTAYVTRGRATRTRIEGSFGSFGDIDVRFRPSGRVKTEGPRGCRGRPHFTFRYGTFAGRIRFTGEDHYVAVRAHRAKGRLRSPLRLHCRRQIGVPLEQQARSHGTTSSSRFAGLFAERRQVESSTGLLVLSEGNRALLLALQEESLGDMAKLSYGLTMARGPSLRYNEFLTSATLEPPRPFRGKGSYRAAPDGATTWTGSLSIAFLGAPRQPLTGPDFTAELDAGF